MRLRVLRHEPADGAANMARDEALLESAMRHGDRVTLSVYRFDRPTMTVGYGQELEDACDLAACKAHEVPIVRRSTGGRALLHQNDTTYCVTGPRLAPSARATYDVCQHALRLALTSLGVPIDCAPVSTSSSPKTLPCLAAPTAHEITSTGRKLVPGAMRYRRQGFLQHGSILWRVDRELWRRLTHLPSGAVLPAVGLHELGTKPFDEDHLDEDKLVDALVAGFEATFATRAQHRELEEDERCTASRLMEKYRSDSWNFRRELPSQAIRDVRAAVG